MRLKGFVNGAYQSRTLVAAGERCINLYPEAIPQGGKAEGGLFPVPGPVDFATVTEPGGRGIFAHKERCFTVFGRKLYELAADGTPTERGTLAVDANPVTFDTNGDGGNELMITSGDKGYILDLGTNVLTTPLASGSTQCGQIDGFLLSLNAATSTFRASDALDGQTWNGLQIAQRTSASDPWTAMITALGEIYLFGPKTGEVWYNAGLPTFPFAQRPEGVFQTGIAAPFSLSRFANAIAWLGQNEHAGLGVYMMSGYQPLKISQPGLDWLIQQYNDTYGVTDARGWSYDRGGHEFYVLTFPKAGRTHVYDQTTQKWHERGFWDIAVAAYTNYRPLFHAYCFGKNLVCDAESNKVYSYSSSVYTDVGGSVLRRSRVTPHMSNENKKLFFPLVELECDRGVGNTVAPGVDPLVNLRYSNNGGHTWGASRSRPIGKKGEHDTRVRWEMCGSGRDRVWEVWQSDPNPSGWYDLYVQARAGAH